MFGLGGIFVEALHDVVFRIAPLDDATAERNARRRFAVRECSMGVRGAEPVDRAALVDVLRRIAQLAVDFPDIAELDLNPLLAFEDRARRGGRAGDIRGEPTTGGTPVPRETATSPGQLENPSRRGDRLTS